MNQKNWQVQQIVERLENLKIAYELVQHLPVFNMEEMEILERGREKQGEAAKNLFLKNARHEFFLVAVKKEKRVDLKKLATLLHCGKLSFGSEAELQGCLGLEKGAVTPLGILNDETGKVRLLLDEDLFCLSEVGVHPYVNTATLWLSPGDLLRLLESGGAVAEKTEIPAL